MLNFSFELTIKEDDAGNSKRRGTLVRQMAGVWNSPAKQTPPPKGNIFKFDLLCKFDLLLKKMHNFHFDSGRSQQVNAYAVSVWKRVRLKLEGRDPDPARKHSNQEQVNILITDIFNLFNSKFTTFSYQNFRLTIS